MKAADVMKRQVITVAPDAMLQNRISGLPVVDDRVQLVGIVPDEIFSAVPKLGQSGTGRHGCSSSCRPAGWPTSMSTLTAVRSKR